MKVILKTNQGRIVLETTTTDYEEAVDPNGDVWTRIDKTAADEEIWKNIATGQLARRKKTA